MKKSMSVLLAAAMCSAMLAGCGSTAADTAADASAETTAAAATEAADSSASAEGVNVFKIGGTAPLTGAAAIYGNAVKNGAQIAVDEINEAGGSVQFELKYEDDENDPEKAVSAYNALKDWGMQISLASVTTKPCEATSTEHFRKIFGDCFRYRCRKVFHFNRELTPYGEEFLKRYARFSEETRSCSKKIFEECFGGFLNA